MVKTAQKTDQIIEVNEPERELKCILVTDGVYKYVYADTGEDYTVKEI